MGREAGVIRTPDQRLRVFVSSSLRELTQERRVLRRAIEGLAMAPVMFELGARPHPPRSLYRAYLEQSDIFVGIYARSYGWIAPGEDVSGLEDEYNLASGIPKLIYLKRTDQREERLEALLDRIRDDDRVSYVVFEDADELAALATTDLATILAEHFDQARRARDDYIERSQDSARGAVTSPPRPLNRLIGRTVEVQRCLTLLTNDHRRVVTLIGPGGIGKTRVALAVAQEAEAAFADGVVFVDLAPIRDPALVIRAIATALGIRDTDDMPLAARLTTALDDRRVLLVLDNVEQVVGAAADLRRLLEHTAVSILATSRVLLRLEGEQPLAVPPLPDVAAVELFAERARGVKPEFELTERNLHDVATVVTALDCLPLAVELAAARVRVLSPAAIAERLDHALPLLAGGSRDHPERQQTMRATIRWSVEMLSGPAKALLLRLGVFRGPFALDAVEWMSQDIDGNGLDLLENLIDSSLVHQRDGSPIAAYGMLATVREYACEELERAGELAQVQQSHAEFYLDLAARAEPELIRSGQAVWVQRLRDEFENLREAGDHLLHTGQADAVAQLVWPLYWFWWVSGRVREATAWIETIRTGRYDASERTRRLAEFYHTVGAIWVEPDPRGISELIALNDYFVGEGDKFAEMFIRNSIALLHMQQPIPETAQADDQLRKAQGLAEQLDSPFLISMALLLRGQVAIARGDVPSSLELFDQSLGAAQESGDVYSRSAALNGLAWVKLATGDVSSAEDLMRQHLVISSTMEHEEGLALAMEGFFAIAAMRGDIPRAGRFLGAADKIRARRGITGPTVFSNHRRILANIEQGPAAKALREAREEGQRAETSVIVEEALG